MRISDINKEIILQYKTKVPDGMGGFVESWTELDTVFAAIWPTSAKERMANMGQAIIVTHKIRIRYRKILKSYWRIKFGNRYFSIIGIINPSESNQMLDLMCQEIT